MRHTIFPATIDTLAIPYPRLLYTLNLLNMALVIAPSQLTEMVLTHEQAMHP
jgi:hypothetical protein